MRKKVQVDFIELSILKVWNPAKDQMLSLTIIHSDHHIGFQKDFALVPRQNSLNFWRMPKKLMKIKRKIRLKLIFKRNKDFWQKMKWENSKISWIMKPLNHPKKIRNPKIKLLSFNQLNNSNHSNSIRHKKHPKLNKFLKLHWVPIIGMFW